MTLLILLIQANVFIPGAIFDGNPYVLKEEVIIIAKGYLKLAWTSPKFRRDSCRLRAICLYTDAAKPQLAISVESEPLSSAIPKSQDHFAH